LKPKFKILIIAGSDSSGGAGIQADIKTVTSLGAYAMTAITAITAQNTTGVSSVVPIHPKEIRKQILFTCKDIMPDAIKIGMLHSSEVILSVISALKKVKTKKIILDPVMVAKGGFKLINERAVKTLREKLMKTAYLITPNIPEAEVLTKTKIKSLEDMIHTANILLELGVKNVLVKGGHRNKKTVNDVFLSRKELKIFKNKKIKPLNKSCELGIKYVNQSIRSNLNYGKGHGPINHLSSIKIDRKFK
jgi:hydroxymethylpyrimidine/phosphomethylpyrimidine kinase